MIKITTLGNKVEVDFNGLDKDYQKLTMTKNYVRTLALTKKKGVKIILSSDDSEYLNAAYIDDVDGVNPATNEDLYSLLKTMFL